MANEEPTVIDQVVLSDSIEKIRHLTKDSEINKLMQEKEYFRLAEIFADVGRNAHIACGMYSKMWLDKESAKQKKETPPT